MTFICSRDQNERMRELMALQPEVISDIMANGEKTLKHCAKDMMQIVMHPGRYEIGGEIDLTH